MKQYFLIGEFAKLHNISKQTLIFYDKIDLLKPIYYDEDNNYRYYSSDQLEILDTIFILKEIGVPLKDISALLKNRSLEKTIATLKKQQIKLDEQINELKRIKKRLNEKLDIFEQASTKSYNQNISYAYEEQMYIYVSPVLKPYNNVEIDKAIKSLLKQLTEKKLNYNYQIGTSTPIDKLKIGQYDQANIVFSYLEKYIKDKNCHVVPAGIYASIMHIGPYKYENKTYQKLVLDINQQGYQIKGPSYSECIVDNLAEASDAKYITRIKIAVEKIVSSD